MRPTARLTDLGEEPAVTRAAPQFAISPRESVDAELTRKLLDYVLSGSLSPGDRLPSERELAQSLGVGRQAVRNAVKSLAVFGIVETRVGSGTYFVGRQSALLPDVIEWGLLLNQSRVDDIIDARQHLELLFVRLAAHRRTDAQLDSLESAVTSMREAVGKSEYGEANARFHLILADMSGNVVLTGVLANIASVLKPFAVAVTAATTDEEITASLPMYDAVVELVRARKPDSAAATLDVLMAPTLSRLRATVADGFPQ